MSKSQQHDHSPLHIFLIFLRMGLTSFGGPIAHLAYFRAEFVDGRKWLSERSYADLMALCQFLPGPASSQVGIALGLSRGGYAGALAAWAGFTLPSALVLILFARGLSSLGESVSAGALQGLKVVAVAVVAQAVWSMARTLCPDAPRITLMLLTTAGALLLPGMWTQIGLIAIAGVIGARLLTPVQAINHAPLNVPITRRTGVLWLMLFFTLLVGLPILTHLLPWTTLALVDAFYRAGSLVFGGGHVVLPLLQAEVVPTGWVDNQVFVAGYGAAQAMPGPLFTFAAFLGASLQGHPSGFIGGLICLLAIFAPAFLLVFGALPFWSAVQGNRRMQAALSGINACVAGLLLAALYQPVWTSAIFGLKDVALALLAFTALMYWKLSPWLVVVASAFIGWLVL
ncbi:chromate efflux transporter [Pseudomonas sp. DWP3-1-2]|uniref:chromate efflux transporter n=1 Tax=Pseudomonas sp. DWP3-1-2 TaxID=2804645 RepID=UPI003CF84383